MSQIRGWAIIPEFAYDEVDNLLFSHEQVEDIIEKARRFADGRISVFLTAKHNTNWIIFFGDFSNHIECGLEAVKEIEILFLQFEEIVKCHVIASNEDPLILYEVQIGSPFSAQELQ